MPAAKSRGAGGGSTQGLNSAGLGHDNASRNRNAITAASMSSPLSVVLSSSDSPTDFAMKPQKGSLVAREEEEDATPADNRPTNGRHLHRRNSNSSTTSTASSNSNSAASIEPKSKSKLSSIAVAAGSFSKTTKIKRPSSANSSLLPSPLSSMLRKSKSAVNTDSNDLGGGIQNTTNGSGIRSRSSAPASPFQPHLNYSPHTNLQPHSYNEQPPASTLLVDQPSSAKWKNWWVRTFWTIIMISGFISILMAGHVWVTALVFAIQIIVYREVISIGILPSKERHLPWFRSLHWYFLASTNYFLYGESIIHYFKPYVFVDAFLMPLATHHRFISFLLYCLGLVNFVLNLKKGNYKFQFSHFCWTHMSLLLIVVQSHFIINNVFEGLIWFVLPVSLVICNDIMAYICGFFWGRTPLIRLSPKKTWEGFVGGLLMTFVFAFFISAALASGSYMTCPMENFQTHVNSGLTCPINPVFVPQSFPIPPALTALIRWITLPSSVLFPSLFSSPPVIRSVLIMPLQFHALLLAAFASLIAPFGGFFASGVKRAFKIKDFGDSIPGHGGLTDRMDCQFIMGVFSSIYFQSFIGTKGITVGMLLQSAVSYLSITEQLELHARLGQYLAGQGVEV
ncbi:hypothetical protein BASA50_008098 [Batrachochytrium salamandrivorans]|uniref:Phosphatidate cytidylyltransferase n=1 Tax=Batrachochytrium salamandrivorans TaxID=1357716 RepID=A0ABQ8F590_9FUNG|nr:hypothetical protein BASA61_010234 [Batrachochytrium salamandrivorans]KAH6592482.1 hypothetical protein BASA50_008098 [Batrachochytrium salamandrivorans]